MMISKKLEYQKYHGNDDFRYFNCMVTNDIIMQMNMGRAFTEEESSEYYHFMISNAELYKVFIVCEDIENIYIGTVSIRVLTEQDEVEIEYMLLPDYWGLGYGTDMVEYLVKFVIDNYNLGSITAITDHNNFRSKSVLSKNKFVFDSSYYIEEENRTSEKYRYLISN